MNNLRPMDAVAALYSSGQGELAQAIVASLSHTLFEGGELSRANKAKQLLARFSYRVLKWTTKSSIATDGEGNPCTSYRNAILDRSGHPYAQSLMGSSSRETEALVEGGDPMNSQYVMISPEIRKNCNVWDRAFLDSVQAKDVRLRMKWETLASYEAAKKRLDAGKAVRIKAVAAGTGLSLILVYDRLVRDGYSPTKITACITDRDPGNIEKANRLMDKLATTRERHALQSGGGILARPEDIFADSQSGVEPYDVLTAIGILEYFHGHTYTTTEKHLKLAPPVEETSAQDLIHRLHSMLNNDGCLIVNTYRRNAATQLLELFGRRFDYRSRQDLAALMASAHFELKGHMGSGHVYDVEVYGKMAPGSLA